MESIHDDDFDKWRNNSMNAMLLKLPMMKFGAGTFVYLSTVLLKSWEDMEQYTGVYHWITLVIGAGSMSTVVMTVLFVYFGPAAVSSPSSKETHDVEIYPTESSEGLGNGNGKGIGTFSSD
eukprot:CAMPEP_0170136812 /NCGR_PEP_ID=MMETSP0033_2-20121228/3633_1 /TAXON_ID=195969 /ORGANISM="Dolichomastix tenuilepis, Strain CCMP3274" /LENGTH=120 /DNA_ID=CAMNT_0010372599 /DNA_START=159 /DNA_END=521 /DNA_ORIENTATION=-